MPQIPEGKNRPSYQDTIIDLLESIALEEMALSHILNAEGEKLQEIVSLFSTKDICYLQMEESCKTVGQILNSVIMKEWLLFQKLNVVIEMSPKINEELPAPCVPYNYNKFKQK